MVKYIGLITHCYQVCYLGLSHSPNCTSSRMDLFAIHLCIAEEELVVPPPFVCVFPLSSAALALQDVTTNMLLPFITQVLVWLYDIPYSVVSFVLGFRLQV